MNELLEKAEKHLEYALSTHEGHYEEAQTQISIAIAYLLFDIAESLDVLSVEAQNK